MENRAEGELRSTGYEIFISSVAVLSIVNLALISIVEDQALDTVLLVMNGLLSVILLGDFCLRLWTAPSRSDYFLRQFGWADLLASIPIPQVKLLRLFRLFRVVRLLRELGFSRIVRTLVRNRAGSALLSLLFVAILVLEFGSLAIIHLESGAADANITTASDAIWYLIVTMSTVGYGDQFPVSDAGRVLGGIVIVIGVGIFGTLTGYLANAFLGSERQPVEAAEDQTPAQRRLAELNELRARIDRLIEEESA